MKPSNLEIQRRRHERYLRERYGWPWSLRIERGEAVIQYGALDTFTIRFPARELFDPQALSKRGF